MQTMFGNYAPTPEEVKRNRRRFAVIVLLVIVNLTIIDFLGIYGSDFLITLKPAYDVEYLLDYGVREGMHVSGQVPYTYGSFATREDAKSGRVYAYYYALPAENGMLILYVPAGKNAAMERLLEETITYIDTGVRPESVVEIEGSIVKAEGRLPYLLTQYMAEVGYTEEEIAAMGDPLMIQDATESMQKSRIRVPLAVIAGALEVIVIVFVILRRKFRTKI